MSTITLNSNMVDSTQRRLELRLNPDSTWSCDPFILQEGKTIPGHTYVAKDVRISSTGGKKDEFTLLLSAQWVDQVELYWVQGHLEGVVACHVREESPAALPLTQGHANPHIRH